MRNYVFIVLLMTSFLYSLNAQDSPYDKKSRLILAGFTVPENPVYLSELPLSDKDDFPLNLKDNPQSLILLFLSPLDPLYNEQSKHFMDFSESIMNKKIKTILVSRTDDFLTRYLGIVRFPAVVIIQPEGEIVSVMEGNIPDWKNENLHLYLQEIY